MLNLIYFRPVSFFKYVLQDPTISDPGKKIKEELNSAIQAEETKLKNLMLEKEHLKQTIVVNEKQTQMWNDILS